MLTGVLCSTIGIEFLKFAFHSFGIALIRPEYLVKGTFRLNFNANSCNFRKSLFGLISRLSW